jgi:hypothetical protein
MPRPNPDTELGLDKWKKPKGSVNRNRSRTDHPRTEPLPVDFFLGLLVCLSSVTPACVPERSIPARGFGLRMPETLQERCER